MVAAIEEKMTIDSLSLGSVVYNLGPLSRVPAGEGRMFQVGDTSVAVFHFRGGKVFATQATCPHQGGPLADGITGAGMVLCPLHAYKFDLATGQPVGNSCRALQTYPVSISQGGDILLSLDSHLCHSEEEWIHEQSQRSTCRPLGRAYE